MSGAVSEPAIEIREVSKTFPGMERPALDRISGRMFPGSITGLAGPDGAGKSTLIRLLIGLLRADSGTIRVVGFDAGREAERIHPLAGYMPQKFGLYEDLSVMENLRLYADLRAVIGRAREEKFRRLLQFTDLDRFRSRLAGKLSGGMKQKLGLACSLLGDPRVLLLDEPSVGVDPLSRRELWEMVQQLLSGGMTVVWSTSYLDEAERCDAVLLLNEGRVLYDGSPADVLERVRGRVWRLGGIAAESRRSVLLRLLSREIVTDAVIQGRAIRVVTAEAETEAPRTAVTEALRTAGTEAARTAKAEATRAFTAERARKPEAEASGNPEAVDSRAGPGFVLEGPGTEKGVWTRAEPRFEDAFLDMLGGGPSGTSALGEAIAEKPPSDVPVIDAQGLGKCFGDFVAVRDTSFRIRRGEIFGLLGPNGAGKSTTFKMLCGLLQPTSGSATVMGLDLKRSSSAARSRIGYMAQKFSLYGPLSVRQNLRFFSGVYGLSGRIRNERVELMIRLFNLRPYLGLSAETLPLGYKQRLALACSVMHQPDVLFLDEPTSGVDPVTRREFWLHINAMVQKGVTVMVTTHFMDEAEYCDRIALIYRGDTIATGTPDDLKERVRGASLPDPSLEDAFVALVRESDAAREGA